MKHLTLTLALSVLAWPALAKLPAPSDDAKAKAAEAAAKAAHGNKVAAYQNCKAIDRAAAHYFKTAAAAKKDVAPALPTPACVDPGAYVAAPPAAAVPAAGAAPVAAAAQKP
ncbi:MAG: hypothetical protein Q8S32_03190 [Burkholderiaceae bacterium]|nr:hypothetical protein [Burkholderiaceae bacterium]MDZ4161524.1 hypothetical protein [Burkholderiales bacterium]